MLKREYILTALAALILAVAASAAEPAKDLLTNGDFTAAGEGGLPQAWAVWKPEWTHAACTVRRTPEGLLVESPPDEPLAVCGIEQKIGGVQGGQAYAVEAACEVRSIASPFQSAIVRVEWTRGGKKCHPAGVLVRGPVVSGSAATFADVLVAPADADGAIISLETKWLRGGSITWKRAGLKATPAPAARKVKVGTVFLRPKNSTPAKNLDLWCGQIEAAGRLGLDIVCLGEAILSVGTGANLQAVAEPIPGPSTARLGAAAKQANLWVVAGLYERDGPRVYNTAVLLDRTGRVAGKYRKTHLPREEWKKGMTPGDEYPVFRTEFGTVGIMICYDWFFPEAAEAFALRGAEILFAPTWGNTLPDSPDGAVDGENTFRVRARDNGLVLVPAVYDGSSMVIDPRGRILASNKGKEGVFWAEVDLTAREALPWVGRWRDIGPRDRRPETYGPLAAPAGLAQP